MKLRPKNQLKYFFTWVIENLFLLLQLIFLFLFSFFFCCENQIATFPSNKCILVCFCLDNKFCFPFTTFLYSFPKNEVKKEVKRNEINSKTRTKKNCHCFWHNVDALRNIFHRNFIHFILFVLGSYRCLVHFCVCRQKSSVCI